MIAIDDADAESVVDIPFDITNAGPRPVTLTLRAKSCACVDARIPSEPLKPKASGRITLRVGVGTSDIVGWAIIGVREDGRVGLQLRFVVRPRLQPGLLVAPSTALVIDRRDHRAARVDLRVRCPGGQIGAPIVAIERPAHAALVLLRDWASGKTASDFHASAELRIDPGVPLPTEVTLRDTLNGFTASVVLADQ